MNTVPGPDPAEPSGATPGFDRAAYLAFVRANHPDVGGDPEVFKAGLARFAEAAEQAPADADRPRDRYDAPIEVVLRPRGLGVILYLIRQWRERRTRPPRVR